MRQAIIYTQAEKETIRQSFIQAKKDFPDMSFKDLFVMANLVLPEDRRRSAKGPSEITWLKDVWIVTPGKARKPKNTPVTLSDHIHNTTEAPAAPVCEDKHHNDVKTASPAVQDEQMNECAIFNPIEQIKSSLVPILTTWLLPAMNDAISIAMDHAFKEVMSTQSISQRLQNLLHEQEIKMKEQMRESTGKRILIVGLLDSQTKFIKDEFGACFRLKFSNSDDNIRHIEDQMKFSDTVIGLTGKISHSIEATLKKHNHYVRVSGLLDGLRHTLTELYVNNV
jgi:hypothetical protein